MNLMTTNSIKFYVYVIRLFTAIAFCLYIFAFAFPWAVILRVYPLEILVNVCKRMLVCLS